MLLNLKELRIFIIIDRNKIVLEYILACQYSIIYLMRFLYSNECSYNGSENMIHYNFKLQSLIILIETYIKKTRKNIGIGLLPVYKLRKLPFKLNL